MTVIEKHDKRNLKEWAPNLVKAIAMCSHLLLAGQLREMQNDLNANNWIVDREEFEKLLSPKLRKEILSYV